MGRGTIDVRLSPTCQLDHSVGSEVDFESEPDDSSGLVQAFSTTRKFGALPPSFFSRRDRDVFRSRPSLRSECGNPEFPSSNFLDFSAHAFFRDTSKAPSVTLHLSEMSFF